MQVTDDTECVFETWTGSRYHIKEGRVQRLNPTTKMKDEGRWLDMYNRPEIKVGSRAFLILEPLSGDAQATYRSTSEVVGIDRL